MPDTAEQTATRLVLGTAQLGIDYGIANRTGKPDQSEADAILQAAWKASVRTLDTAQAYGNSEAVIGRFLKANPRCPFRIITKLSPDADPADPEAIRAAVGKSVRRLGGPPEGLLLHNGQWLKAWDGPLGETLGELQRRGDIGRLGVSVYRPDEFRLALDIPQITMIQAPFNVFDRRLLEAGLLDKARQKGRRVFLRSALLQGLLLIRPNGLPAGMAFAEKNLMGWWELLERFQHAPLKAALKFVLQAVPETEIVIGCETAKQFQEIARHMDGPGLGPDAMAAIAALPPAPDRLLNPSQWGAK